MQATGFKADIFRGPVAMQMLFEGPSAFLGKLHAHVTRILPGEGYAAHRDEHDVSIFLIEGEIAVLGKNIVAPAVVFFPAGHLHDMKAVWGQSRRNTSSGNSTGREAGARARQKFPFRLKRLTRSRAVTSRTRGGSRHSLCNSARIASKSRISAFE